MVVKGEVDVKEKREQKRTIRLLRLRHIKLTQPEIAKRDMARIIEQDILRLQIPIDDIEHMQVLQRREQFRGVESTPVFVELSFFLQMVE